MKRWIARVAWLTLGLVLLMPMAALAVYRGTDPFENISPQDRVGGLASKYPLDRYGLDYHVDFGISNPGGIVPEIQHSFAQQVWDLVANVIKLTIDVFAWAFSTDLLTGPNGALPAIAAGIQNFNNHLVSEGWLYFAIVCAGGWGIHKALLQRQLGAALTGFAMSLLCAVAAMVIVASPVKIIGGTSNFANDVSTSFMSGFGSAGNGAQGQRNVTDHLFETMIYRPWVVLNFGGLEHCVDTDTLDKDGFPAPVSTQDPRRDICRDHLASHNGFGGYATRFLKYRIGSDERTAEYDVLRKGEVPVGDPQFAGYRVDKADAPAVDIQQAGGARSRARALILVAIGALGVILLFGRLAITVLIAQIVALGLLGLAPIALIIGIFPAGQKFFKWWITRLFTAIFIKIIYAVVIAVLIAVSAAMLAATASAGFLVSFGLQTIYFWAVYLKRKMIVNELSEALGGAGGHARTAALTAAGVNAASRPYRSLLGRRRRAMAAGAGAGVGAAAASGADDDTFTEDDALLVADDRVAEHEQMWHDDPDGAGLGPGKTNGKGKTQPSGGASAKPVAPRGKRKYRVIKDPDELEALQGGNGGEKVSFALIGTEQGPSKPKRDTEPSPAQDEDPQPVESLGATSSTEPSPREIHEEAVQRLRKKRKVRVRAQVAHDPDGQVTDADDQQALFDRETDDEE